MIQRRVLCFTILFLLFIPVGKARDTYSPVDFSLEFKSMHLWRGIEVSPSALLAASLGYTDRSDTFGAGIWCGAGFTGDFREFDYYLTYSYKGFTAALWDIYNFSPEAEYNNKQAFNYRASETGHFVDLSIGYRFGEEFPLGLGWATILYGRDRGSENRKNLYSTYIWADYPFLRRWAVDVDAGIAGAFALDKESGTSANFYGHKAGIVAVTVTATKVLKFGRNYSMPVSATALFNPVENHVNLQVAVTLF